LELTVAAAPVFHVGNHVQQIAPPRRTGYVTSVQGSGWNAVIWVALKGWHPATFRPGQITRI
jgi:hypothetical protein